MNGMTIREIQDIKRRRREYFEAIEPIVRDRVKLAMMSTRVTVYPATGAVVHDYPDAVKALDDRYVELMKVEQRRFFRESDGINLGTSDKPVCVNRNNAGQLAALAQRLSLEHVQP